MSASAMKVAQGVTEWGVIDGPPGEGASFLPIAPSLALLPTGGTWALHVPALYSRLFF